MQNFRPVTTDEFIPPVSNWTSAGGLMLIGTIGLIFTLSALVKFNLTIKGSATVRPQGEVRFVQSSQDGKVASIEVSNNQKVQKGDVIAYLDRANLENQQQQLKNNLQQQQIQANRLEEQINLLDTQIASEEQALDREIMVAQTEISLSQQEFQQLTTTAQANLAEAQATLKLAESEMARFQQLATTGAISQLQLEEKQTAVQVAQAQITRMQVVLNPSIAPIAIAKERANREKARREATLANLKREQAALKQRRAETEAQILREQKELKQIERQLENSIIRATNDGTILQLNLRNPNQIVRSGDTIAQIAPGNNNLSIKTAVATQDIDKVELGQTAKMRIDACPYSDYGILNGTVNAISPDAILSKVSGDASNSVITNANSHFEVTIQPETNILSHSTLKCQLKPGMRAQVNIIARKETLLRFVLRKARLLTNF
ncbi:HlyD family secretion protein [Hyella patelloides LEGE 07179]|uniref:HlyD family secretion protein n=1 Tax=Hyella patelloides LEGE 07179 TaxID=945734 RepID=A0A563VPF7_9CYAN|nr:HlyD family efflux transporter periplasmic adaptor subunit [Hyella patelloides]VEP13291.1 HlyD family secretion protein [Hyella patelloides LEGE 07179]